MITKTKATRPLKPGQEPFRRRPTPKPGAKLVPPGATSTTTPAGIAKLDPHVEAARKANDPDAGDRHCFASIGVHQIQVVANPRKTFDETALAELAASIKEHGLLQPLTVRRTGKPGCYELVAGERRLRACKLAGLIHSVNVAVVTLTDAQAAEMRLVENLQRQDLSAIEEAEAFAELLKAHGHTQEQLAATLGKSQPHIANRLRLLKLPKTWQGRIISGEIPATHARALLSYAACPQIMAACEKTIQQDVKYPHNAQLLDKSYEEFAQEVEWIAQRHTRGIGETEYRYELGGRVKNFEPTPEQLKQLAVIDVDGKPRATNTKLFDQLQKNHVAKLVREKAKGKKAKAAKGQKAKPKSEALRAREAAEGEKQSAREFAEGLGEWRENWLRYLLAKRIVGTVPPDSELGLRVAFAAWTAGEEPPNDADWCDLVGFKKPPRGHRAGEESAAAVARVPDPIAALRTLAARSLWNFKTNEPGPRWRCAVNVESIEPLALRAGIDLAAAGKRELAGPLTEAFFNLHAEGLLGPLAAELRIDLAGCKNRKEKIARLSKSPSAKLTFPKAIAPLAPPKPKRKKAAKR